MTLFISFIAYSLFASVKSIFITTTSDGIRDNAVLRSLSNSLQLLHWSSKTVKTTLFAFPKASVNSVHEKVVYSPYHPSEELFSQPFKKSCSDRESQLPV